MRSLQWMIVGAIAVALVVLTGIWGSRKKEQAKVHGMYKFTKLPEGLIARNGDIVVRFQDIVDAHYSGLVQQKKEIEIALAYKQKVAPLKPAEVFFSGNPETLDWKKICGLYQLSCDKNLKVKFVESQKQLVHVNGSSFTEADLDKNSLAWQANATAIVNYLISKMEKFLFEKFIFDDARSVNKQVQEYIQEVVYKNTNIEAAAKANVDSRGGKAENGPAEYTLEAELMKQALAFDYIKEKHLKPPVELSLIKPAIQMELKWDWIPHAGDSKAPMRVIFATDYVSDASKKIIYDIPRLAKRWPNVVFGHRPAFLPSDNHQVMIAELSVCAWNMYSPKYWEFLAELVKLPKKDFEKLSFLLVESMSMDAQKMRDCFLARKYKAAVEYHLQWAQHFGAVGSPVTFAQDEVYRGPINEYTLRRVLQRQ